MHQSILVSSFFEQAFVKHLPWAQLDTGPALKELITQMRKYMLDK